MNPEFENTSPATKIPAAHIEAALTKGVHYLSQHQFPNGEFCVYVSGTDDMREAVPDSNIFPSALIGASLAFLQERPGVEEILSATARFLFAQIGWGASWNHFTNGHLLRPLCPQDADDTACVSAFLRYRKLFSPEEHNRPLLLSNRRRDGLFYTWFALRPAWNRNSIYWRLALKEFKHPVKSFLFWKKMECARNDVDAAVNANVLFYLGDCPETQAIIRHLVEVIDDNREENCDKWYRDIFSVFYFFSRNYYAGIKALEPMRQPMISRLLRQAGANGSFGDNPLHTALSVATLLNLGYSGEALDDATAYLLSTQLPDGEWPRRRFYYGGPAKIIGYGSEELTTAFCLEALQRYRQYKEC